PARLPYASRREKLAIGRRSTVFRSYPICSACQFIWAGRGLPLWEGSIGPPIEPQCIVSHHRLTLARGPLESGLGHQQAICIAAARHDMWKVASPQDPLGTKAIEHRADQVMAIRVGKMLARKVIEAA